MIKMILAFEIGRKYNGKKSQGSLQFLGANSIGDFINNYDLFSENGEYFDGGGNSVELTEEEVESGIGTINYDGSYDTIYTTEVEIDDDGYVEGTLTKDEHNAIFWSEDSSFDDIKEALGIKERF